MTAEENVLFGAGCVICIFGTMKMQGQAKDSMASAAQTSLSAHGRNGVGNAAHTTGRSDGSPIGGANRDELDDLLHLLEIDTTTRNCERLSPRLLRFVKCLAKMPILRHLCQFRGC
jgi:hypothetical protein